MKCHKLRWLSKESSPSLSTATTTNYNCMFTANLCGVLANLLPSNNYNRHPLREYLTWGCLTSAPILRSTTYGLLWGPLQIIGIWSPSHTNQIAGLLETCQCSERWWVIIYSDVNHVLVCCELWAVCLYMINRSIFASVTTNIAGGRTHTVTIILCRTC